MTDYLKDLYVKGKLSINKFDEIMTLRTVDVKREVYQSLPKNERPDHQYLVATQKKKKRQTPEAMYLSGEIDLLKFSDLKYPERMEKRIHQQQTYPLPEAMYDCISSAYDADLANIKCMECDKRVCRKCMYDMFVTFAPRSSAHTCCCIQTHLPEVAQPSRSRAIGSISPRADPLHPHQGPPLVAAVRRGGTAMVVAALASPHSRARVRRRRAGGRGDRGPSPRASVGERGGGSAAGGTARRPTLPTCGPAYRRRRRISSSPSPSPPRTRKMRSRPGHRATRGWARAHACQREAASRRTSDAEAVQLAFRRRFSGRRLLVDLEPSPLLVQRGRDGLPTQTPASVRRKASS